MTRRKKIETGLAVAMTLGMVSTVTGVAFIYWPAALVVAGVIVFFLAATAMSALPRGDR